MHRMKSVHMFTNLLSFVHTGILFTKYILLCAHFLPKSLYTSQQTAPSAHHCWPSRQPEGPPIRLFSSLTVILQGGNSGLSAGPVFRMMACPEHCAFCAHMEPFMSHETDSGRENGRLGPGRLHSRDPWAGGALVCNWEHQATCASVANLRPQAAHLNAFAYCPLKAIAGYWPTGAVHDR